MVTVASDFSNRTEMLEYIRPTDNSVIIGSRRPIVSIRLTVYLPPLWFFLALNIQSWITALGCIWSVSAQIDVAMTLAIFYFYSTQFVGRPKKKF